MHPELDAGGVQRPLTQVRPCPQAKSQTPQLCGSLARSAQPDSQQPVRGLPVAIVPGSWGQTLPQRRQLCRSAKVLLGVGRRFVQVPPQQFGCSGGQAAHWKTWRVTVSPQLKMVTPPARALTTYCPSNQSRTAPSGLTVPIPSIEKLTSVDGGGQVAVAGKQNPLPAGSIPLKLS